MSIEQPFVGAKRAVKPERVVEACGHERLFEHGAPVGNQRGIEQQHVGCIGEHALMDCGLIRKLRGGPDPDMEAAVLDLFPEIAVEFLLRTFNAAAA